MIRVLLFISFFTTTVSCSAGTSGEGKNDEVQNVVTAQSIAVLDIRNSGNASDLDISFTAANASSNQIKEFRFFIIKESERNQVSVEMAMALSAPSFISITPNASTQPYEFSPTATFKDVGGSDIVGGTNHLGFVLSIAEESEESKSAVSGSSGLFTISTTDVVTSLASGVPVGTGGVSIDDNGNIYLSDFGITNNRGSNIYKVTPDGQSTLFATGLVGAAGSDFGPNGNLYQSNISGNNISIINPAGDVSTYVGNSNMIVGPVGLIVEDGPLNLFITNCNGNSIARIDSTKQISIIAQGALFSCPNGITMDDNRNLYITNFNNANIIKITPDGTTSLFKTLPGGQNTHLVYHNNFLYVVARGDFRVYKVDIATGAEEAIAGNGIKGIRDGQALRAQFSRPNDIDITPDGLFLYINDSSPNDNAQGRIGPVTLRKISLEVSSQ